MDRRQFLQSVLASPVVLSSDRLNQGAPTLDRPVGKTENWTVVRQECEPASHFRPYIEVIPELPRPTQISLYCVTGGNRRFNSYLPGDIASWDWNEQLICVKRAVLENFEKHQGRTFFMGMIRGYFYYPADNARRIRLTVDGDPDETAAPYVVVGPSALTFPNGKAVGEFL